MSTHLPTAGHNSTGDPAEVHPTGPLPEQAPEATSPESDSNSSPLLSAEAQETHDAAAAVLVDQHGSPVEGGVSTENSAQELPESTTTPPIPDNSSKVTEGDEEVIDEGNPAGGVKGFLDDERGSLDLTTIGSRMRDFFTGGTGFQRKLHERTEKGFARQAINGGKMIGAGAVSYAPTAGYLSAAGTGLKESLAYANLTGIAEAGLVVPGAGPGLIFLERKIATWLGSKASYAESEKRINAVLIDPDLNRRFWSDYKRELKADQENLIDEDGEEELLQAFHHSNFAGPHSTPYLGSRDNYAHYCMLQMLALCGYSAGGTSKVLGENALKALLDKNTQGNTALLDRWKHSIDDLNARLSKEDKKTLAKYNVFSNLTPEKINSRLKAIRQTSIAYGRLLEKYHTERREAQVTGSIIAPAVLTSAATASPVPLIGAGLFYAGRKGYRAIVGRKGMVNLDFDENDPVNGDLHGRDGGPIIPASLARKRGGAGIYQHAVLVQCSGKTQADLTEPQKYWYKHIDLHVSRPRYASTRWKKPEDLAVYCAAAVQKDLAKVKFQKAIIDADKLRDAKEEFRYSTDKFTAAKNELKDHDRTVLDNNSALINAHKAFQDYQNKAKTDSAYKSEVVSVGKQIVHLKRDRERLIAKGVRDALIAAVTDWEKKEKDAKEQVTILQNPGQSLKEIGLEEAGKNLDIQRAFAVKIQEEFAALKTGGWNIGGALGKGARAVATSNPVKNVAKDLGEIALATGFFSGAAYGAAAYTATISAPTAGLLVGGAVLTAKVYQKLKKWTIG